MPNLRVNQTGPFRYAKTADGVQDAIIAAGSEVRTIVIHAVCTEAFANGTGAQTEFLIGDTATDDSISDNTDFTDAAAGDVFILNPVALPAGEALIVTATAATGTGTGALCITAVEIYGEAS